MKTPTILCLLFNFACITQYLGAQNYDAEPDHYFRQIRSGINATSPWAKLDSSQARTRLISITPFLSDSNRMVRAKACELAFNIAIRAADSIRHYGVNLLLDVCLAGDSETTGMALGFLTKFTREDFTESARNQARSLLDLKPTFTVELIKLAGFLQLADLGAKIRSYSMPGHRPALRWAALIALARMGDDHAITEVMSRVKRLPLNDELIYNVFPDLVFIRQREAIDYMLEVLNRQTPDCQSADAERPVAIPCGYRILELLAPIIRDYPLRVGNAGDLETDDYVSALIEIRQWFIVHSNYTIMTNRY